MKKIILFLSLLLVLLGLFLLVQEFIPPVAFDWQDLLMYLIGAAVVYVVILLIGNSLNKKFNASISRFIEGKQEKLLNDKKSLGTYGLLLVTFLPYLIFLEIFALYATITIVILALGLVLSLPEVPIAVLIGLGIVLLGTCLGVLIGFYRLVFPRKKVSYGIEIGKNEQKKLWELTKDVAKEIKAKPITRIIVTPNPGVGVYLEGNNLQTIFGGGNRVLEIGLPSIHGLSVDEFKAILAHEYGHFSNADTQWSSFTYAMSNSLIGALQSTPGPSSRSKGIVGGVMALNPAYWLLFSFTILYFRATNGFSRIREVMADIRAMDLYGGDAFKRGLLKVATNDGIFVTIIQGELVPDLLKQGKTISDFSVFMDVAYDHVNKLDAEEAEAVKKAVLNSDKKSNAYDSHPALKDRLAYAARFGDETETSKELVADLFEDWHEINKKAADMYNVRTVAQLRHLLPKEDASDADASSNEKE